MNDLNSISITFKFKIFHHKNLENINRLKEFKLLNIEKRVKMEVVLLDIGKYTGEVNKEGRPHGKGSLR